MNALQQNRVIIAQQLISEILIGQRTNDIGKFMRNPLMSFTAMIIMYILAKIIQCWLWTTPIFKAMEVYFNAEAMQGLYFVKNINHAAVISRIRHIEGNNMQMFFH